MFDLQLTRLNVSRNDDSQWDYVGNAGGAGVFESCVLLFQ
jgi:hypothetical protein